MANNDRVYEAYIGEMGEKFKKETVERIDWIIEQASDATNVLDIGCSQGVVSLLLAQKGKMVTGVDIQPEAIEFAKELQNNSVFENSNNVVFLCGDINEMNFEKKFDCIVITEVIEHIDNPQLILENASKFLVENGRLIISVPFGLSKHHDHKKTYYLGNFVRLISCYFNLNKIDFMGNWIGAICEKSEKMHDVNDVLSLYEEIYEEELEKRENSYLDRYNEVLSKHKKAVDDYYTMKEWLKNTQDKVEKIKEEKELLLEKYNKSQEERETLLEKYNKSQEERETLLEKYNKSQEDYSTMQECLKHSEQEVKESLVRFDKTKTDYYTMKGWFEEKRSRVKELESHEQELMKALADYATLEQESQSIIKKAKNTIQKQKKEIQIYKSELENYRRIMDKIHNTWYGRLALKCYRILKKVKFIA